MNTSPRISLIVATYNWPRALALVLASVRAQRVLPFELIVADDGSRDDTRELVERERALLPVPLVHVWHEDTGFRLAAIRNKATAIARGDYVVQIDGDIVLHPDFVGAHAAFAQRGSWVQGSRALCSEALTQRLLAGAPVSLGPFTPGLDNRVNALHAPWLTPFVRGERTALRRVRGCHMAFWRDDLLRVNGYDEAMEGWGREDSELASRLCHAGVQRRNLKFSAVCYHLWHRQAGTDAVARNHERFLQTVREHRVRCVRGIDQHLLFGGSRGLTATVRAHFSEAPVHRPDRRSSSRSRPARGGGPNRGTSGHPRDVRPTTVGGDVAVVNRKGAQRLRGGHPWVFRSDVEQAPALPAGVVRVEESNGTPMGWALWSPRSEISLRRIEADATRTIDATWWHDTLRSAIARRAPLAAEANAYRLVHGEGDGLPSLVVDRYGDSLVVQLLSAGLDAHTETIVASLRELTGCTGILARNDPAARDREGLPREVKLLFGEVPRVIEVLEHGVRYLAAPWDGQKTGAFLDQRENRVLIGGLARGRALDCFAYHGSFALHLAKQADHVCAVDVSAPALARVHEHAERNGLHNIEPVEGDAFDVLRAWHREGRQFDTIVVDPPAFAKTRGALDGAMRGYKDINLQAMKLLAPGGLLFTASCSFHLSRGLFFDMLSEAVADSGRRFALRAITGQPLDHPELINVPETGYLKGALLEAMG